MSTPFEPVIGQWYIDDELKLFEVVAADDESVEIQYYDGDVDEYDIDIWYMQNIRPVAEPNDGGGPFDDEHDPEDLSHIINDYQPVTWQH